jgi:hypothetical protein
MQSSRSRHRRQLQRFRRELFLNTTATTAKASAVQRALPKKPLPQTVPTTPLLHVEEEKPDKDTLFMRGRRGRTIQSLQAYLQEPGQSKYAIDIYIVISISVDNK